MPGVLFVPFDPVDAAVIIGANQRLHPCGRASPFRHPVGDQVVHAAQMTHQFRKHHALAGGDGIACRTRQGCGHQLAKLFNLCVQLRQERGGVHRCSLKSRLPKSLTFSIDEAVDIQMTGDCCRLRVPHADDFGSLQALHFDTAPNIAAC